MAVRTAEVVPRDVSPGKLSKAGNPCAVKSGDLEEPLRKYSRQVAAFEDTTLGIAAHVVDGSAHPEIARLRDLAPEVTGSAFGSTDILRDPTEAEDLVLQGAGAKFAPELVSGKYDAGLAAPTIGYAGKGPRLSNRVGGR